MSFNVALSGLNAARAGLDATGNNIANVNTTGYKGARAQFADLYAATAAGLALHQIGAGVRLAGVQQSFSQGALEFTDNPLDLAINGEGFFTMSDNGQHVYTRAGTFGLDRDGFVQNAAGQRLLVHPANDNGGFDTGTLTELQITAADNPPRATTSIELAANLPATAQPPAIGVFDPADVDSFNHATSMTIYDSLGTAQVATFYFVRDAAANSWTMHAYVDGQRVTPDAGQTLAFGSDGRLQAPADGRVALDPFNLGRGAEDQSITIDLSAMTQYASSFTNQALRQDGYTTGRLVGLEVSSDGVIFSRYTNGQATPLGQIALATFSNPHGLRQLGETSWAETFESGQPVRGVANSGNFGAIQAGALEASNVNLAEQLVEMIIAQRNFQANAQMIQTEDQITQTVINLR